MKTPRQKLRQSINPMPPMKTQWKVAILSACAVSLPCSHAAVTVFPQDLAGFNAAAGSPPVAINFDSIAAGTDIGGTSIAGVTFIQTGSALLVVAGASTTTPGSFGGLIDPDTNKLFPTSGANVLSPGGAVLGPGFDPSVESDGLSIEFASPVKAFGFDHLSQSADGFSFSSISVYDALNNALFNGAIPISNIGGVGGGAAGGADFWGITSDTPIKRIRINEDDANDTYPDCNIGFDTFRFGTVPEPQTWGAFTTLSLAGFALWRRRAAK